MRIPARISAVTVVVALACAATFLTYAFLPLAAPTRYNSPDEASNAFFSAHFAKTGYLWYFEPLNLPGKGVVHPRSVRVVDDFLVPGGFIGLPVLYGGIGRLFGVGVIPYLTPLFALAGIAAWGALVRWRFGTKVGVTSAVLLAAHPAWWYASSRTLMPNVLFTSLVVVAAWLFFTTPVRDAVERRTKDGLRLLRASDGALAGIAVGLAVAVRMAETYWLALAAAVLLVVAWRRKSVPWARIAVFAAFAALTLAPFLLMNQTLYGHPLATGYGAGVDVPAGNLPHGMGDRLLGPLRPLLFPLGFAPRVALANFWTYGIAFFGWWSVLVTCALVAAIGSWKRQPAPWRKDAAAFAAASGAAVAWLALFYGSWTVQDNPDPSAVTIGSSYLRYWLPAFVLSTAPVAWLAVTAVERGVHSRVAKPVAAAVLLLYVAASGLDVFGAHGEGLLAVRQNVIRYDATVKDIVAITPKGSVIIVDRADKYVFPDRPVITPLRADSTYAALDVLKRHAAIWYFGITFPEQDLAWLRDEKLPPLGLDIEPVKAFGEETLYRLAPREPQQP